MNRVSIAQLEAFYWVAELGSVHRAAAHLNVTQPTLSLRLRKLEAELAAPVLERYGRGVRLSRSGHAFLAKVKPVLDAYGHLHKAGTPATIDGRIRIGLAEGFAIACLRHLVPALAGQYKLLRPEWTVTTSSALEQELLQGNLDLAVLVDPIGDRALRLVPLGPQGNVWAATPALARQLRTSPRAMSRQTVITTPPPTSMYRNTIAWFASARQKPGPLCICTSVNAAAQLVAAGIGIGIFPKRMIEAYRPSGALAVIASKPQLAAGRVYLAHHVTADADRIEAVMRVIEGVTAELNYFDIKAGRKKSASRRRTIRRSPLRR
ncbi:MAG TPA: LysR family transcriptional regulator [Bradyrhizobium sp.]|uniref:LysR family transcriptional regulator n=1 Tax=Bradyrhizobium sp. TaxID=376 RepID=UPI002D7F353D|nr:LysR family transcriptional regulator [Bradyrhizobium sp.]HET7889089.1 LysR family transcriptional regulator [Bradyrhizobium sp.]